MGHRLKTVPPRIAEAGKAAGPRAAWAHPHRESRHARGYGAEWERTRERILARDHGICQHCKALHGVVHMGSEVDHRVPKFEGGTDADDNLQTICSEAHRIKTAEESKRARGITL